jgi:phospholipase C
MSLKTAAKQTLHCVRASTIVLAVLQMSLGDTLQAQQAQIQTRTPIKHVIVIIGENRTFDHIFATYQGKNGQFVDNLLSKKIVKADGTPGPFYFLAGQRSADVTNSPFFQLSPKNKAIYSQLPAPLTGGPSDVCVNNGICNLADAESSENGLPTEYYPFLLTGGTGLPGKTPDTRITGVNAQAPYSSLLPGPFQLTNTNKSDRFPYDSYAASPVHRFYQMWQQSDCNAAYATPSNPSGCQADLFPWVEVTVGSNVNGAPQPANFSTDYAPGQVTTGEGSTARRCSLSEVPRRQLRNER